MLYLVISFHYLRKLSPEFKVTGKMPGEKRNVCIEISLCGIKDMYKQVKIKRRMVFKDQFSAVASYKKRVTFITIITSFAYENNAESQLPGAYVRAVGCIAGCICGLRILTESTGVSRRYRKHVFRFA